MLIVSCLSVYELHTNRVVHCKTRCKGTLAPWFVFIHLALHIFLKGLFLINFSLKTKSSTHLYLLIFFIQFI